MVPIEDILVIVLGIAGSIGCIPIALLFIDYRKRKEIHKPFIYIVVFVFAVAIALPFLLKTFGIRLALMAPFAVMGYAAAASTRSKHR